MSRNSIARLVVELGANTAAFQGDMGKASRIADQELKSIKQSAEVVGKAVGGALAAGAAAFAVMANASLAAADQTFKTAQQIGMSTEKVSAYNYAAKMAGVENEAVATSFKKLNNNIVDAARGQGAAKDAFQALGISLQDQNGQLKDNDTVMREVANRFSQFEDGAIKTALATDIFGKAGADLIPLLNGGVEGLDAMAVEAQNLGQIFDEQTARNAELVNDNLARMQSAMSGAVNQVVAEMLPTFSQLTSQMVQTAQDGEFLKNVADGLSVVFKLVVSAGMGVKMVLVAIGDSMGALAASIVQAAQGNFSQAWEILNDQTSAQEAMGTIENIKNLWADTTTVADQATESQRRAMAAAPAYQPKEAKPSANKGKSEKPFDANKAFADWEREYAAQEAAAQQLAAQFDAGAADRAFAMWEEEFAKEEEANKRRIEQAETLRQSLLSKREVEMQDFASKQMVVQQSILSEQEKFTLLGQLEEQHRERVRLLDEDELARKQQYAMAAVSFAQGALSAIGARSSTAAKAAKAIAKANALNQIRMDTPKAAMAAAGAVAGIPVVGPALAIAAKAAMYSLGAAQVAAVMSGGSTTSSGGGGSIPVGSAAASDVQPASEREANRPMQYTTIKIDSDQIYLGRQLVDLMNEVMGDGKTAQITRFAT